jgi:non-ribosomal peptide synthase protein (TIGR01720 family)
MLVKERLDVFHARHHSPACREAFHAHATGELLFNFLGRYQQLERSDSLLTNVDPNNLLPAKHREAVADGDITTSRLAMFEASALVETDVLKVEFTYNKHMDHTRQIELWVSTWKEALYALSKHLCSTTPALTLSDFPLLRTDYRRLREFTEKVIPQFGFESFDDIEDMYPCSPMQRDLIVSQGRNSDLYNVQSTWKITDEFVDVRLLKQAWGLVCARHPVLRTVFVAGLLDGLELTQVVLGSTQPRFVSVRCEAHSLDDTLTNLYPVPYTDTRPPNHLIFIETD